MRIFKTPMRDGVTGSSWRGEIAEMAESDAGSRLARTLAKTCTQPKILPDVLMAIANLCSTEDCGPVVIKGIPISADSGSTLSDGVNTLLLGGILDAAGVSVFSYSEQKNGKLFQDLVPLPGLEHVKSSAGRVPLPWHTDEACFRREYRAEAIALLCLDNPGRTCTRYAAADALMRALGSTTVKILRQPRFRFSTPETWVVFGGKIVTSEPRPVLQPGPHDLLEISLGKTTPLPGDREARVALDDLSRALAEHDADSTILEPGDLLVFSNVRGLHTRDAITGVRNMKRACFRSDLSDLWRASSSSDRTEPTFSCEDFVLK